MFIRFILLGLLILAPIVFLYELENYEIYFSFVRTLVLIFGVHALLDIAENLKGDD